MNRKWEKKPEIKIGVKVWGSKTKCLQIYSLEEFALQKIKIDKELHLIIKTIRGVSFSIPTEILLGSFPALPLFIEIRKIGGINFVSKKFKPVGFLLFNGNKTTLQKATKMEIQKEFRSKILVFLRNQWEEKTRKFVFNQTRKMLSADELKKIRKFFGHSD